MKLVTLGPKGTYSYCAARLYDPKSEIELAPTIQEVARIVSGNKDKKGFIPLENSIQGIVAEALDSMYQYKLMIEDELVLDIHHSLLSISKDVPNVHTVYSHPQALGQCREYLSRHYPGCQLITTSSTMEGVLTMLDKQDPGILSIGPEQASEIDGVEVVDKHIEDEDNNQTRFAVCTAAITLKRLPFILLAVLPYEDRVGLLYDILKVLKGLEVNITQIESRPSRDKLGSYMFYVRLQIDSDDDRYKTILKEMREVGVSVRRMSI
jgi:prephenate dehydratase